MQLLFSLSRLIITLIFLTYSSWSDYKTREVTNRVWVIYAPIAVALTLPEIMLYTPTNLYFYLISVGLTTFFSLLLFYTGGFGGADSKALICIALALPFFPTLIVTPLFPNGISPISQTIFPLTVLTNAVFIAAGCAIYLLAVNFTKKICKNTILFEDNLSKESIWKKIVVLLTSQKMSLSTLNQKWHIYPMEDVTFQTDSNQFKRKLVIVPRDEGRDQIIDRLTQASQKGLIKPQIWATPGLPMLIFITTGLIIALLFGDISWIIVTLLFG